MVNFSLWRLLPTTFQDKLAARYPDLKTLADRVSGRLRTFRISGETLRILEDLWDSVAADVSLAFPSLAAVVSELLDDIHTVCRTIDSPCFFEEQVRCGSGGGCGGSDGQWWYSWSKL